MTEKIMILLVMAMCLHLGLGKKCKDNEAKMNIEVESFMTVLGKGDEYDDVSTQIENFNKLIQSWGTSGKISATSATGMTASVEAAYNEATEQHTYISNKYSRTSFRSRDDNMLLQEVTTTIKVENKPVQITKTHREIGPAANPSDPYDQQSRYNKRFMKNKYRKDIECGNPCSWKEDSCVLSPEKILKAIIKKTRDNVLDIVYSKVPRNG